MMLRLCGALCALALVTACVGGAPMSENEELNDPNFSGVTNTDAGDGTYTPTTGGV